MAASISKRMAEIQANFDKEKCLLKHFFVGVDVGEIRWIFEAYWDCDWASSVRAAKVGRHSCLWALGCICYLLAALWYIFRNALQSDHHHPQMRWMLTVASSWVVEYALLSPLVILVRGILIPWLFYDDVQGLRQYLIRFGKLVMLRRAGLLKQSNSMLQHLNPACRAAKRFPALNVARLLL